MGSTNNNVPGKTNSGTPHDGQKNYQNSNERNPDNARSNPSKHHYEDHDQMTNDENYDAGVPTHKDLDFRDKKDNLESEKD